MKAYADRVIVEFDPDENNGDGPIVGEIISIGSSVPDELEEGMEVIIGKFAGQIIDNKIILNHTEILAINE